MLSERFRKLFALGPQDQVIQKSDFQHRLSTELLSRYQHALRYIDAQAFYKPIDAADGITQTDGGGWNFEPRTLYTHPEVTAQSQFNTPSEDIAIE